MPSESVSQSHLTELLVAGTRVVLRSRLAPGESTPGGPTLTDTLGEVISVTADEVVIDTRGGPATVARSSIVLAKRVPPPPPRRAPRAHPNAIGIDELEALMVSGMPPLESTHIGDWLLRAANGYTGRANSALAVGDPGLPLPDVIDRVAEWYAERGQPALIQLPHETGANPTVLPLGSLLTQRNWRVFQSTLVMTFSDATVPAGSDTVQVEVTAAPTDGWWAASSPRALAHRETLARLLALVGEGAYLTAYLEGRPVGHARLAWSGGWSGIFDIHTDPGVRRLGVATALMKAATRAASEQRILLQYLQVSADNDAAVRLYESLGWQVHHEYHYATDRPVQP